MYREENEKYIAQLRKMNRSYYVNLFDKDSLERILMYAAAEYRDYNYYFETLFELSGLFDESLEHYDFESWFGLGIPEFKCNQIYKECFFVLDEATETFHRLVERSKKYLELVMKVIITSQATTQEKIIGRTVNIKPNKIHRWMEELYDSLDSGDYAYYHNIEKNYKSFMEAVKDKLDAEQKEEV